MKPLKISLFAISMSNADLSRCGVTRCIFDLQSSNGSPSINIDITGALFTFSLSSILNVKRAQVMSIFIEELPLLFMKSDNINLKFQLKF